MLGTLKVHISKGQNKPILVTAILDSGSQGTILTTKCAQRLGINLKPIDMLLNGISDVSTPVKGLTKINIATIDGLSVVRDLNVIVLDKIASDLPKFNKSTALENKIKNLKLANSQFNNPQTIDLLIGADLYGQVVTGTKIDLGANYPTAIETIFGYVLIGSCESNIILSKSISMLTTKDIDLNKIMQQFWNNEEPPIETKLSIDENECEAHYASNTHREPDGRYVTSLPFKLNPLSLGKSADNAKNRFFHLEKKLNANPQLKTAYEEFINDYINSGHMHLANDSILSSKHYFLPHHAVFKESSSTTKLRVVFDGSAKTSTGLSLNDTLHCGPKLLNNICDIVFQFRRHNVVFSCDIRQMYRQIKIATADQPYQLIFWRSDESQPLSIYKLTTVTYGLKPSSYLAIRTLKQLAMDEGIAYPDASNVIINNIYVDDIVTGATDVSSALKLQNQLINLLDQGQFQLRKWSSNAPELLHAVPEDYRETPLYFRSPDQPLFCILGIKWLPANDSFSYTIEISSHPCTKRSLLSLIARIYDPCGWLTPVIFYAKCLIQILWTLGISWDEPLPENISKDWKTFTNELPALEQLRIARNLQLDDAKDIQLHGFSDASEQGYAAVVYLRISDSNNVIKTHILIAKSKVAPLKRISLPRLELCGAHLLAKLINYSTNLIQPFHQINAIRCWSDSTVTLSWIKTPAYKLKVYIANRVSQIQEWTPPEVWSHVPTCHNPADCATRTTSPFAILKHPLWWTGPRWLQRSIQEWPNAPHPVLDIIPELRSKPLLVGLSTFKEWDLLTRFSTWSTLKRTTAYVLRFISNCKNQKRDSGPLSSQELNASELIIVKLVQQNAFKEEIHLLKSNKNCKTKLQRLQPFMDKIHMLRVGGRIKFSSVSYNAKHPLLLPKDHHVTQLLIKHYHLKYLHAGPQLVQSLLTQNFWILSARNAIRSCIFKCITCFKAKPQNKPPLMGDLPPNRVTPGKPFSKTGIDFAGPFSVKIHTLRNAKITKVYLCIFVCLSTKAIHLEVAMDLSTDAFLDTLTRFISRRGLCSDIYCDCGTNFMGAAAKLKRLQSTLSKSPNFTNAITKFTAEQYMNFHFSPPAAPHIGGLWESAVKCAKHHLTRTIGKQILILTDFITLTTKVEAILNSRPLVALSNDPSDLMALTPGHFLTGQALVTLPEQDLTDVPTNRLKHWQQIQALSQRLWKRWSVEYLHTLQQRTKWTSPSENLRIGDLVIIHDPQSRPLSWPLGRVIDTHPGKDGHVRVVTLRTASGILSRPAVKVFKLPTEDNLH